MRYVLWLGLMLACLSAYAGDGGAEDLQRRFESRYQTYLSPGSQSTLPFEKMEQAAWKAVLASGDLTAVFSRSGVFYMGKTYVFTLYQADKGRYYLHAKGGFWGMEELAFGPIAREMLQ